MHLCLCRSIFKNVPSIHRIGAPAFSDVSGIVEDFNRDIRNGGVVPIYKLAKIYGNKVAIQDVFGKITYNKLFQNAKHLRSQIVDRLGGRTGNTVTYLCDSDSSHVIVQWAIWMSGNIAVPLSPHHPGPLIEHYLKDSDSSLTISDEKHIQILSDVIKDRPLITIVPSNLNLESPDSILTRRTSNLLEDFPDNDFYANSDALIIYTSGTTSKPKGVPYTFKQIAAQISSLHTAWHYKYDDILLHTLPLHHVHGLINSVCATLAVGATLKMLRSFDAKLVWTHLLGMNRKNRETVSVFMGVPTMYTKLINEYDKIFAKNTRQRDFIRSYLANKLRLMVSGSAPLPVPIFERWEEISGHRLLERYGMTEIGMALSNPYTPMSDRTPGFVGTTLPGVSAKIVPISTSPIPSPGVTMHSSPPNVDINLKNYGFRPQPDGVRNLFSEEKQDRKKEKIVFDDNDVTNDISGELLVRGPAVFKSYWRNPRQTDKSFTKDGWFKTGDTAIFTDGKFKILGRTSVDIIKSGGYKISALEVETVLLSHDAISDVAVLGLPDITWGEKVVAVISLKGTKSLQLKELQMWAADFLPKYQLPSEIIFIESIPRNAMGKINKVELKQSLLRKSRY